MRNIIFLAGTLAVAALLGSGCTGPEQKLGRGFSNINELTRGGEFQRAVEQDSFFMGSNIGFHTGIIQGTDHTFERVGMGFYEVLTFPFPPYEPVLTKWVKPKPSFPDSVVPANYSVPETDSDQLLGFTGSNVGFWVPGSHFTIFSN